MSEWNVPEGVTPDLSYVERVLEEEIRGAAVRLSFAPDEIWPQIAGLVLTLEVIRAVPVPAAAPTAPKEAGAE